MEDGQRQNLRKILLDWHEEIERFGDSGNKFTVKTMTGILLCLDVDRRQANQILADTKNYYMKIVPLGGRR